VVIHGVLDLSVAGGDGPLLPLSAPSRGGAGIWGGSVLARGSWLVGWPLMGFDGVMAGIVPYLHRLTYCSPSSQI
jgi:hypothetical protein